MSQLKSYIHQFSSLRTDKNRYRWTESTNFRAPHKPLLLLSILDLFAQGTIKSNFIEITPELGTIFSKYWYLIMPPGRRGNMALPFFHLRSSKFWHLIPLPEKDEMVKNIRQVDTLSQLQNLILGAKLDEELFQILLVEELRNSLRTILIQSYFSTEFHLPLLQQGVVNLESYFYSQELIKKVQNQTKEKISDEDRYKVNVRDQGFRRAVVSVYGHRCAICGVRMMTVEGHSAIDAAHIIPWSISHNDDPRNGIALCRLCHWTFDEGLASMSSKYTVLLSSELRTNLNFPGHLLTLENRPILGPEDSNFMPSTELITWHRKNIYRAS